MNKTSVESCNVSCRWEFHQEMLFQRPKIQTFFQGGMPQRCCHFCLMVLVPLQPLHMSWPRSTHTPPTEEMVNRYFHVFGHPRTTEVNLKFFLPPPPAPSDGTNFLCGGDMDLSWNDTLLVTFRLYSVSKM